ncbi:MAG TPA: diglucosylglycerate octanoyltransferase [Mycobacteriales bacterium]
MPEPLHLLVLGDSLTFYGPARGELLDDPRLYANVAARALSTPDAPVVADIVARVGWTARDAWWAMTRDPYVYSVLLPRASAVLLAVGGMDYLPTAVPTWLREGIRYLRPPAVRRVVRGAYRRVQPVLAPVTPWRGLPQHLTDSYLDRCVGGVRYFHPGVPVIGMIPPEHRAVAYGGVPRGHRAAVAAAVAWGERSGVPMLDFNPLVNPHLAAGQANPDGMHFGWESHADIGAGLAEVVRAGWAAG